MRSLQQVAYVCFRFLVWVVLLGLKAQPFKDTVFYAGSLSSILLLRKEAVKRVVLFRGAIIAKQQILGKIN